MKCDIWTVVLSFAFSNGERSISSQSPCELVLYQPIIEEANYYKFHKQSTGWDWNGLELREWISLISRINLKILPRVRLLVPSSVIMMPWFIILMHSVVRWDVLRVTRLKQNFVYFDVHKHAPTFFRIQLSDKHQTKGKEYACFHINVTDSRFINAHLRELMSSQISTTRELVRMMNSMIWIKHITSSWSPISTWWEFWSSGFLGIVPLTWMNCVSQLYFIIHAGELSPNSPL